jgi:YD repeat-containing protein
MNISLRLPLLIISGFVVFIGCKKDNPSPNSSTGTTCQLASFSSYTSLTSNYSIGSGSSYATGGNTSTSSIVYTYNSQNQITSVHYGFGGSSFFIYDAQGRLSTITSSGSSSSLIFDGNGNLIRANSTTNGNFSGYTLYTFSPNYIKTVDYNSSGIPWDMNEYTISGENIIQTLQTEFDNTGTLVTTTNLQAYENYDSNLNGFYIAFKSLPNGLFVLSKNNPKVSTFVSKSYFNGIFNNSSTSTTISTFIYNSSGVAIKETDINYNFDGISTIGIDTSYSSFNYINCN